MIDYHVGLFIYWTVIMAVCAFSIAPPLLTWLSIRDTVSLLYVWIFLILTIQFGINAIARSPDPIFDVFLMVIIQRALWAPLVFLLITLADIHIAEHNHHAGLLARVVDYLIREKRENGSKQRTHFARE